MVLLSQSTQCSDSTKPFFVWLIAKRRRWDSNPRGLFTLHDFQSCSLGHYETPPKKPAERVGFEPTRAFTLPLFESGTFDHSDISPCKSIAYLPIPDKHRILV